MLQKLTPYIRNQLSQPHIRSQYLLKGQPPQEDRGFTSDPLREDMFEVRKGLVHKYENRVLIKISYRCAAHCRFCTRLRQIGNPAGDLRLADIKNIENYLRQNPQVSEVILSGGDPLYTPGNTASVLERLKHITSLRVFRMGTRLPIHSPGSLSNLGVTRLLTLVDQIGHDRPFYILVHFEHPDELTRETRDAIKAIRESHVTVMSQTVFLKGINNSYKILFDLFQRLYDIGVIPYYLYRCDYVKGVEQFICDLEAERQIMTKLRNTLSGIACPTYVIDSPGGGVGKLPVPLKYWDVTNPTKCQDFKGTDVDI